jgi:type I restriction enzyme, R subunit
MSNSIHFKQLLGLDINAAKEAFSEFLEDKTLTVSQIHFINSIIDFFVSNGRLDAKKLFQEQSFTGLQPSGIIGLFLD